MSGTNKRRLRYVSISAAIVIAFGIYPALQAYHAAKQRRPAAVIVELGGVVTYSDGIPRRLENLLGNDCIATVNVVYLDGTNITDADLLHLKALPDVEVLNLARTKITDDGLEYLKGLKRLKTVVLVETGVTDVGVEDLRESLPQAKIYN